MCYNPFIDFEEDEIKGVVQQGDFRPSGEEGKMGLARLYVPWDFQK
jgi:hypothetical protein